jgi:hypothetical protein
VPQLRVIVTAFGTVRGKDLDDLRASGLTNQTIQEAGVYTEQDEWKLADILNCLPETPRKEVPRHLLFGGLVFPHWDLDGSVNCYAAVKPHQPKTHKGKPVKYENPHGKPVRAYFPTKSLDKLNDGQSPIYITEGVKKALALSQLDLAAIGIPGIWCGCKTNCPDELSPDLAAISWQDRDVYIAFDYDPSPEVRRDADKAKTRLAKALKSAGVKDVFSIEVPPGTSNGSKQGTTSKQGIDDYLVAQSVDTGSGNKLNDLICLQTEAFAKLIGDASPILVGMEGNKFNDLICFRKEPMLGTDAYHGFIGEYLKAIGPLTEATHPCLLGNLIPALCTRIGPDIFTYGGDKEPPKVFVAIVGPTARGRKGTGWTPSRELMRKTAHDFWVKGLQPANGLSSGEGLIAKVADKRTWNEETKDWDIEEQEKRLLVLEPEFSKVLKQNRRDANILSEIIRQAYDGPDLSVLTKVPLGARGTHINILGHITPDELRRRLTDLEIANGFANRFLWLAVKSGTWIVQPEPIPSKVLDPLAERLKDIFKFTDTLQKPLPNAILPPAVWVEMDGETKVLWAKEYKELNSSTR